MRTDGLTDGKTETDMMKLIVAFRIFANAPKSAYGLPARLFVRDVAIKRPDCARSS